MIEQKKPSKVERIRKGDRHLLPAFFEFTETVFPSTDFHKWHQLGYWTGNYEPHTLISEGRIISNVSATLMDIFINGSRKKGVQIGTVGTIPEERGHGLSRQLMDHVIKKYKTKADIFFLFANETVLEFYPKFGFSRVAESLYQTAVNSGNNSSGLKKMDLRNKDDRDIINRFASNRIPLTSLFGAEGYESITWWHLLNVYRNDIYFSEEDDILLIMYPSKNKLKLIDVISTKPPDPQRLINEISGFGNTSSILYHFPPDQIPFPYDNMIRDEDTMFFVRGDFDLSPGFKFPVTAQT